MRAGHSIAFLISLLCCLGSGVAAGADSVDFARDVQPIFQAHCVECHGPKKQKNGFRLDRRRDAMMGGTMTMIGRGNADASRLYLHLIGDTVGKQMPPDGPLSAGEIRTIKAWIDQGAPWPDALAGETPPPAPDPKATRMMNALREGDRAEFRKLLRDDPGAARLKGPDGSTPLMYAVLYADVEAVRLLLNTGADVNDHNEAGATALMWAADDADKTRVLLDAGARPNDRSKDGRTPLLVATAWSRSYEVVKLLLEHGANPSDVVNSYRGPLTPLRFAAEKGDEAVLRLLLDRGANAKDLGGVLPLVEALHAREVHSTKLLLPFADRNAVKSAAQLLVPPLATPEALTDPFAIETLVAAGADVAARDADGRTVLMLAVISDWASVPTIEALIRLGADVNAVTPDGRTALDFALRRGHTPVVDVLTRAGSTEGHARVAQDTKAKPKPATSARSALERSLPLLQRSDVLFLQKAGCVSCHNNSLTAMTISLARLAKIPFDEQTARNQREDIGTYVEVWRERALQGMGIPGDSNSANWILLGLAAEHYPPNASTDALARYLKNDQFPDGHWRLIADRPPLGSSEIELTAIAMRALQAFAPNTRRGEYEKNIWRAANWLRTARPASTADHAFQLLGLSWAGEGKEALKQVAADLSARQKVDGGWSQLPSMASDAYATGQALVALSESGAIDVADPAYRRGVDYLLSTQLQDGSWHVRSRAIGFQPYFESGFPHGHDQWISAAATNWAAMALIKSLPSAAPFSLRASRE